MKVFLFDFVPYGENLDRFKADGHLPWPLGKKYFKPDVAVRTYAEHLAAWQEMERYGFDGVGINEHHGTPYGSMNSPNLLAASIFQRTQKLKVLIYGNLLPLYEPLRLAEELAMLDCLSNGRLIAGVARGAPREYRFHNIPMAESRARFEECFEIMRRAWTEESFSYQGKFHSYKDVAIWPRPVQSPHPPVWVPITGSKESIEWAAKYNLPITPGTGSFGGPGGIPLVEDIVRHYAKCQAKYGRAVTPDHLNVFIDCYVADSKEQAIKEYAPHSLYYFNTLFAFDHVTQDQIAGKGYYSASSGDFRRSNSVAAIANDSIFGGMTMEMVRAQAETAAWGPADECVKRIIAEAEHAGAETVILTCNRGAMPQEMFLNQIRRIGEEVLPRLKAHKVARVQFAEGAP
ncbi:MAG: LLM class flavin-dependent oxidoreductase [Alphaproteobacteria bacterium]